MEQNNYNIDNNPPEFGNNSGFQQAVPNSTLGLVFGILSIVLVCCCYGVLGIGLGIAAMIIGAKAMKVYNENPQSFTSQSFSNAKIGRITGIIGLVIGILHLILGIILLSYVGFENINNPQVIKEMLENMQNR